jgi:hypothetical protein
MQHAAAAGTGLTTAARVNYSELWHGFYFANNYTFLAKKLFKATVTVQHHAIVLHNGIFSHRRRHATTFDLSSRRLHGSFGYNIRSAVPFEARNNGRRRRRRRRRRWLQRLHTRFGTGYCETEERQILSRKPA